MIERLSWATVRRVVILIAGASAIMTLAAPAAEKPNIVLFLADDLNERLFDDTSGLVALAGGGTRFRLTTPSPLCSPSRASLLTGLHNHNHGVLNNRKPSKKTWLARHEGRALPDWLAAAGYRTILAGKLIGGGCPGCGRQGWNVRIDVERGPDGLHPSGRYWLDQLADDAASAIRSTPAEQPIFLWFAPASPHAPFVAKSEYRGRFRDFEPARVPSFNEEDISDKTNPEIVGRKPFSEAGIGAIVATRRTRMEMMLSVEDALRELIGVLRDTGRLDHTYIFFMSDNGFFEGEHRRPAGKGMPYEEAIEVPLFVLGPDVPRDVSASLVYNHDLTATIADLASLSPPPLDGRSLAPLWRGKTIVWRKRVLLEHYNRSLQRAWVGVRTPTRKAIIYRVGRDASEVYDLVSDPLELTNIASRSAARALLGRHLEALLSCSGDGCWAAETAPD